ncbi:MAG: NAD(P)/FAD-dependent oxidoreductase [Candidatus Izemoplasmatales bacterium]|jgi:glycerol-3-phosphate dehydrogenase
MTYDVIIIGAGVIGTNIARELAKYQLDIAVLEMNLDVCEGTSKANSGIVHSGYDAKFGSLKAKYNVIGNRLMEPLCKELAVTFKHNGSLVLAFSPSESETLRALLEQGRKNGVVGLKILEREQVLEMEPNVSNNVYQALYAPSSGIVDPFELTLAAAEVAALNGVNFHFGTKVENIEKKDCQFQITTNRGQFYSRIVINAAGVYADDINNLLSEYRYSIRPRKGEYCLFDKQVGNYVKSTLFQLPTEKGKGVLVTPTAEGNLLIGPNSEDIDDKNDTSTSAEGIKDIIAKAKISVANIPLPYLITGFAGLRASEKNGDFVIGEAKDVPGFFNALGIESPGLTAAPAIAIEIAEQVSRSLKAKFREGYVSSRDKAVHFESLSIEGKKELFQKDKNYGKVICRCELVTLAEILDSIRRPLGARTVDGVKRRTRAGSGRCQGGFCSPRIVEILAKELGKDLREIVKSSEKSTYLIGLDKELL